MRIAHVDTERTWRGGQQQVLSLIEGLKAKGHQNFAVVRKGSALAERLAGVCPLFEVDPWGEWDFIAAHRVNRFLKREKIDVVHAHSGHGVALASFSTAGTRIPVIATRRVDFHLAKNFLSRWKYRKLRKIVAISEGVKTILLQDGIPPNQITLIPSGIDFKRHQGIQPFSKEEMGVPPEAKVVGQVAALAPHKDQATFLKAIAILKEKDPRVRAVIVGDGPLRAELEELSIALGINSVVSFFGFREDALRCLASFDVFCLSSQEEGLGTSLLDAMALGVPIVATQVGGIPDVVQDGVTGTLVPPRDPERLAQALHSTLQNTPYNKEQRQKEVARAKGFDISNTIEKTADLYQQILSTDLST